MSTSECEYLSVTDTAKMLRVALREQFPGVKFSVRSDKYAGGASIRVGWTDGPTEAEVDGLASLYQGATFDGMRDLKEYHSTILVGPGGELRDVHFGADFVFCNRDVSPEFLGACMCRAEPVRVSGVMTCDPGCRRGFGEFGWLVYPKQPHRSEDHFTIHCSPGCAGRWLARWESA